MVKRLQKWKVTVMWKAEDVGQAWGRTVGCSQWARELLRAVCVQRGADAPRKLPRLAVEHRTLIPPLKGLGADDWLEQAPATAAVRAPRTPCGGVCARGCEWCVCVCVSVCESHH